MGGSALTAERQLRGSSFTNATARKWLAAEERGERETCKAEVPFDHPEQPEINQSTGASKH